MNIYFLFGDCTELFASKIPSSDMALTLSLALNKCWGSSYRFPLSLVPYRTLSHLTWYHCIRLPGLVTLVPFNLSVALVTANESLPLALATTSRTLKSRRKIIKGLTIGFTNANVWRQIPFRICIRREYEQGFSLTSPQSLCFQTVHSAIRHGLVEAAVTATSHSLSWTFSVPRWQLTWRCWFPSPQVTEHCRNNMAPMVNYTISLKDFLLSNLNLLQSFFSFYL